MNVLQPATCTCQDTTTAPHYVKILTGALSLETIPSLPYASMKRLKTIVLLNAMGFCQAIVNVHQT